MSGTATQREWVALADGLRAGLAELAKLVPAMKPDEAKALIEAAKEAMLFHQNALSWDEDMADGSFGFVTTSQNGQPVESAANDE